MSLIPHGAPLVNAHVLTVRQSAPLIHLGTGRSALPQPRWTAQLAVGSGAPTATTPSELGRLHSFALGMVRAERESARQALIGPPESEELLLAAGAVIEATLARN